MVNRQQKVTQGCWANLDTFASFKLNFRHFKQNILDFQSFGLDPKIMQGIESMHYNEPTPVQAKVIPAILSGKDVIASARTGTGKTAAFLLPVLHTILQTPPEDYIKCLVIVPTRELAIQIAQQVEGFSYFAPVSSLAIYGGSDGAAFSAEKKALTTGSDIVICTPGRLISHLNLGYVNFSQLKSIVLDEADRMLDMGFLGDILKILSHTPLQTQRLLFSATMPINIRTLARKILQKPLEISIDLEMPQNKIMQEACILEENQKNSQILEIISTDSNLQSVLIFCQTKLEVKKLSQSLSKKLDRVGEIHSDLDQNAREQVLNQFKSRQLRVLVATDILSRGIDVEDIDMVMNYQVPRDLEDYVHRIGRTARASSTGRACTLVTPLEKRRFAAIQKFVGFEIKTTLLVADDKLSVTKDNSQESQRNPKKASNRSFDEKKNFSRGNKKRTSTVKTTTKAKFTNP